MIERITITIKKDLLRKVDRLVDGREIRNRSHAIEKLIAKSISKSGISTALIMAGQGGVKASTPKALISISGKSMLEHQIDFLRDYGITNIIVALDSEAEQVRQRFGDGRTYGVNIKYITEETPMGTAGAIYLAKDYIEGSFVMLNVDTLMNPNIHDVYDFHRQHGKLATVLLTTTDDPSRFGVVKMKGNQVTKFTEKPRADSETSRLINAGFCIFERKVADMIPNRKIMIEELFKNLCKQGQLMGFLHSDLVFDTGKKNGYERAVKEWDSYKNL